MRNDLLHLIFRVGYFLNIKVLDIFSRMLHKVPMYFKSGWVSKRFHRCGDGFLIMLPYTIIGHKHIQIGKNFSAKSNLRLEAYNKYGDYSYTPSIIIGDDVNMNFDCHIGCINKVVIGNKVLMASKIFITDHYHGSIDEAVLNVPPATRPLFSKGPVIIEENVWIGEGVAIMPGVTIGRNSIIGANAVVTKSFPENSVIGGNPAKLLKTLN